MSGYSLLSYANTQTNNNTDSVQSKFVNNASKLVSRLITNTKKNPLRQLQSRYLIGLTGGRYGQVSDELYFPLPEQPARRKKKSSTRKNIKNCPEETSKTSKSRKRAVSSKKIHKKQKGSAKKTPKNNKRIVKIPNSIF